MKKSLQILLRSLWAGVFVLATPLGAPAPARAQQVPDRLNYQGMLRKGDGTPEPAGYKDIEFRIYDAPTAGTLQWAHSHRVNLDSNGLFNVVLNEGGSPITTGNPLYTDLTSVFTTDSLNRYLELKVSGFNPIQPRQRFVSAAYAFQAADVTQANKNFTVMGSLTVQSGAHVSSLTVDTTATLNKITPGTTLTLDGDVALGTQSGDYQHLGLGGGNSWGYLYGASNPLGDGIHLGYNYYVDAAGNGHVHNTGGGTSRLTVGYGRIMLATGPVNTAPVDHMYMGEDGNVGIGTMSPRGGLEIERGTNNTQPALRLSSSSLSHGSGLWLENRSTNAPLVTNIWSIYTAADHGRLSVANERTAQSAMTITTNLNVGIGTSSPAAKLDVNGSIMVKSVAPIVIRRYFLPDLANQGYQGPHYYDPVPGYNYNDWSAGVIGFTCSGDFADTVGYYLLDVAMQKNPNLEKWRVQFDLRHHSTLTNIVVDVMYVRKELVDDDRR